MEKQHHPNKDAGTETAVADYMAALEVAFNCHKNKCAKDRSARSDTLTALGRGGLGGAGVYRGVRGGKGEGASPHLSLVGSQQIMPEQEVATQTRYL